MLSSSEVLYDFSHISCLYSQHYKNMHLQYIERIRNLYMWYIFCILFDIFDMFYLPFYSHFFHKKGEQLNFRISHGSNIFFIQGYPPRLNIENSHLKIARIIFSCRHVLLKTLLSQPHTGEIINKRLRPLFSSVFIIGKGGSFPKNYRFCLYRGKYEQTAWYHGRGNSELHYLHSSRSGI